MFATIEEGVNQTFKEKLTRLHAHHNNLIISDYLPTQLNGYDVIFIDSVNTFHLSPKDLRMLRNQYPNKFFIYIFQVVKNGQFKGAQEFEHDVNVVIQVINSIASTIGHKNRFGKSGEMNLRCGKNLVIRQIFCSFAEIFSY